MRKLLLLFALIALVWPADAGTIWIDTDVAIGSPIREVDDAFALVLAFQSPELRIAGISTTYGNAPLRDTTRIAQRLVRDYGQAGGLTVDDVFAGAASASERGRRTSASEALASSLRKQRLTYIAIGPLTNLATFLQLHPTLSHRIERVIFVGGKASEDGLGFGVEQRFHIHDANVFKDPAAVAVVLRSRIPLWLTPIRAATDLMIDQADLRQLQRSGAAGSYLARNSQVWLSFWTLFARTKGGPLFDPLALIPVTRPALLSLKRIFAQLDTSGNLVVAPNLTSGRPVLYGAALALRAKEFVMGRLTAPRSKGASARPTR